jgi:soluble lytic murein transglycosylase-like protein
LAWVLLAVVFLPLMGLVYFLKPRSRSGVLEAGPLTAELGPEAAAPSPAGSAPAAPSARLVEAGKAAPPVEVSSEPTSGARGSEPFPQGPDVSLEDNSLVGAGGGSLSGGGAAAGEAGKSAAAAAEGARRAGSGAEGGKEGASGPAALARATAQGTSGRHAGVEDAAGELEKALSLGKAGSAANPAMKAFLKAAKPGAMLFDPKQVIAAGGRAGQGSVSMESNSKVTAENYNPSAQGLSSSKGKEPPGPKIPAGKAPALPSAHLPYILKAAQATGVDPALIAATAARESNFRYGAYRAEPHLKQVQWRAAPGASAKSYFDGSLGPMQVLRSNFLSRGIGSDAQANDLATNYRIGAQIIRGDMNAFPNNSWKAVAAYNVGVYGAKLGRVPANNYTNTILEWRKEYDKAIAPYR